MIWVYYLLLLLLDGAGLVLALFTLPGLWLIMAAAGGYALLTRHRDLMGTGTILTLFGLALVSEFVEVGLTGAEAKKAGGGKGAMIGGIVGGVVGGIFLTFLLPIPLLGTVFGICLGSFIGAAGFELSSGKEADHSLRVGVGAAKGRFYGIVSKMVFGLAMTVVVLVMGFP